MTVAELIAELQKRDPTRLVAIDTAELPKGLYPAADTLVDFDGGQGYGEEYSAVVLLPSEWPQTQV